MKKICYINKFSNGISLITLMIVIVVILIISSSIVITIIMNDGTILSAYEAKYKSDFQTIKETINTYMINESTNINSNQSEIEYMGVKKVNSILNVESYKNKIGVYNKKLVLLKDKQEDIEYKSAKDLGYQILNMTPEEFDYYIELGKIKDTIKNKKYVGRELNTNDFQDTITLNNITYGNGWYLIGNYTDEEKINKTYNNHYKILEITDITHAPYLVNYETEKVLSVKGMIMYDEKVLVHTFNN